MIVKTFAPSILSIPVAVAVAGSSQLPVIADSHYEDKSQTINGVRFDVSVLDYLTEECQYKYLLWSMDNQTDTGKTVTVKDPDESILPVFGNNQTNLTPREVLSGVNGYLTSFCSDKLNTNFKFEVSLISPDSFYKQWRNKPLSGMRRGFAA